MFRVCDFFALSDLALSDFGDKGFDLDTVTEGLIFEPGDKDLTPGDSLGFVAGDIVLGLV